MKTGPGTMIMAALLLAVLFPPSAAAAPLKLQVSPPNALTLPGAGPAQFPGGAGTDFTSVASAAGVKTMNISNAVGNWRVYVRRADSSWNSNMILSVQRTGDGTGGTITTPGSVYYAVATSDTEIFRGSGDVSGIPLQYQVSGTLAASGVTTGTYTTNVIFTLTDGF